MADQLVWKPGKPCNGQTYYMTAGKFQLAKYRRGDVREYVLFEGNKRHPDTGFYTTSKEAMAVAEELASRQA